MLGPPAASQRSTQLLLAAQHARHPLEVGGELGRGELLGDPVQLAVELVQVGTGRTHGLERRSLVTERMLGEHETTIPRCRTARTGSGSSSPAINRSIVDLPEPFAPTTPTRVPVSTATSSPSSTVLLPNDLRTALS